ncbi:MAG: FtsQ-type POTRA domain-containing protein [Ferruginibacter sp.]
MNKKAYILKIVTGICWALAGAGLIFLLVSAVLVKEHKHCAGLHVKITGATSNIFIDRTDVEKTIYQYAGKSLEGKPIQQFRLREIENRLKKNIWVKSVEIYFDNNNVLQAEVEEREPIARIFAENGNSFYIDSSLAILPLSEKFSARVPLVTGFPTDARVFSPRDSALLRSIRKLTVLLAADSFLNALVEQVTITPARQFEFVPKIGTQVIAFGDARFAEEKFERLKLFYRQVMSQAGLNRYSYIDLKYKNQVVVRLRGKNEIKEDSLRTMQLMHVMAQRAAREAADSTMNFIPDAENNTTNANMITTSKERETP